MHPRQKQINEAIGGRDPSLVFDGKTPEEHAKTLTESVGGGAGDADPTTARAVAAERVKKASLKDKLPSIAQACDGTRDKSLSKAAFDR